MRIHSPRHSSAFAQFTRLFLFAVTIACWSSFAATAAAADPQGASGSLPVIVKFVGVKVIPVGGVYSVSGQVTCNEGNANLRVEFGDAFLGVTVYTNRFGQFSFLGIVPPGDEVSAIAYSPSDVASDVSICLLQ